MYPGLVSCPFYAIPIYPFKFMKFFIYLYRIGIAIIEKHFKIHMDGRGPSSAHHTVSRNKVA